MKNTYYNWQTHVCSVKIRFLADQLFFFFFFAATLSSGWRKTNSINILAYRLQKLRKILIEIDTETEPKNKASRNQQLNPSDNPLVGPLWMVLDSNSSALISSVNTFLIK